MVHHNVVACGVKHFVKEHGSTFVGIGFNTPFTTTCFHKTDVGLKTSIDEVCIGRAVHERGNRPRTAPAILVVLHMEYHSVVQQGRDNAPLCNTVRHRKLC